MIFNGLNARTQQALCPIAAGWTRQSPSSSDGLPGCALPCWLTNICPVTHTLVPCLLHPTAGFSLNFRTRNKHMHPFFKLSCLNYARQFCLTHVSTRKQHHFNMCPLVLIALWPDPTDACRLDPILQSCFVESGRTLLTRQD